MSDSYFSFPSLIALLCQCGKAYLTTRTREVSFSGNSTCYHNVFQAFEISNESLEEVMWIFTFSTWLFLYKIMLKITLISWKPKSFKQIIPCALHSPYVNVVFTSLLKFTNKSSACKYNTFTEKLLIIRVMVLFNIQQNKKEKCAPPFHWS